MKYSLFIPTIPKHFHFLNEILEKYKNGSEQPDEIIISISESSKINQDDIRILKNNFNIKIIEHNNIMLAGPNRQVSKEFCNGDVIIYQDSDDLPHFQRIEVIKSFFENDYFIMDDLRIYEDGNFESGSWSDRQRIGGDGINFIYDLLSKTHFIERDYRNEGYIICKPLKFINL
jgi:hypothetical protein